MRAILSIGLAGALCAYLTVSSIGQAPAGNKDEKEVLQPLEKLVKSFNTGDAKGLAAVWSEKGEYISEDTGERLEGRKAIESDYADTFSKNKVIRLEVDINKVRRIGNDVASVEGTARVIRPKQTISRSQFVVMLVRENGVWMIDNVRESKMSTADSNAAFLDELEWLNGTWLHKDGDTEVSLQCEDVANGNFRTHRFQVKSKGEIVHQGTQVIGWDPIKQQLRSWVFSSDGSFGEGPIERKDIQWFIRVSGVLPNGDKSAATQIITRKDNNHFTWQVIDRHVGTQVLPNVSEVTLTKVATANPKKGG